MSEEDEPKNDKNEGEGFHGIALIAVMAVMIAVGLGAMATQWYTWTTPTEVAQLTSTVTLSQENEMGAVWNGSETFSNVPNIYVKSGVGERYDIGFIIDNFTGDNLVEAYADLRAEITIGGQTISDNLVIDSVDQPETETTLDNNGSGYAPGNTLTTTVTILENTQAVETDSSVQFEMRVYALEH